MERITMWKNSKKYGFKEGEEFMVKRDINGMCVIIMPDGNKPNLVWTEDRARSYGLLEGEPQLCFN